MKFHEKIILLGGGGHAKVLIGLIRGLKKFHIAGVLDSGLQARSSVLGIPVLGGDDMLQNLFQNNIRNACIAVGSVRDNTKRKTLFEDVRMMGFNIPVLVDVRACISQNNTYLAPGVQVMMGAIIQANTIVGENTIINTGAVVDHDCHIGSHIHIAPGAVVCGGNVIEDQVFIGAGATIIHGINIGQGAIVGAGAVVLQDVPEHSQVVGVPAR